MNSLLKTLFLLTILCITTIELSAQKDTVKTRRGETFIGTVEKMNQAVLTFDSESGDSDYKIEWKEVVYISTYNHLRASVGKREILIVYLRDDDPDDNTLKLIGDDFEREIAYDQILSLQKISDDFWGKVDLNINLGYNYAKSTKTHQFTTRTSANYLTEKWGLKGNYDEFFTLIDTVQSSRTEGAISSQYILPSSWYTEVSSNWFSSDEQQIALRTTLMAGFGRFLINNQSRYLLLSIGGAFNRERFQQEEVNINETAELFLKSDYVLFDHKYFGINSAFTGFMNVDEADRYRASFSLDFSWDIGDDFDLVWGYSLNFDSKPPNGGEQSDYVLSLTIGFEL